jgi:hypothetical protein
MFGTGEEFQLVDYLVPGRQVEKAQVSAVPKYLEVRLFHPSVAVLEEE